MNLNVNEWKEFKLGNIFRIEPTKGKDSTELIEGNDIPYIGAKHDDNGSMMNCRLEGFESWVSKGNCVVFIQLGAGSAGYANYIPCDFIGMNGKTSCGYIDDIMTPEIGLFLASLLCLERPKYSFGRSWTGNRLKETILKLPICKDQNNQPIIDKTYKYSKEGYVPDFEFMENYIKSLQHKPLTTTIQQEFTPTLNITEWKEHKIGDIFKKVKVKKYSAIPEIDGDNYFISSTSSNNGVAKKVDEPTIKGNCITVSTNGDCFDCFYHSDRIVVSNDVEVLYNKNLNPFIALFICTILKAEKCKWSYGRKPKNNKVYETTIKLPTTPSGEPDWKWMENYIKSLPYSDKL